MQARPKPQHKTYTNRHYDDCLIDRMLKHHPATCRLGANARRCKVALEIRRVPERQREFRNMSVLSKINKATLNSCRMHFTTLPCHQQESFGSDRALQLGRLATAMDVPRTRALCASLFMFVGPRDLVPE